MLDKLQTILKRKTNKDDTYEEGTDDFLREVAGCLITELPLMYSLSLATNLIGNVFANMKEQGKNNLKQTFSDLIYAIVSDFKEICEDDPRSLKEGLEELLKGITPLQSRSVELEKAVCMILCKHFIADAVGSIAANLLGAIVHSAKKKDSLAARSIYEGFMDDLKNECEEILKGK
jgi:hypothetical protein